jgi:phosphatidylglycerophosphate synthase
MLISMLVGRPVIRPRWTGKVATVLQMATVLWILVKLPEAWLLWLAFAAAALTAASGALYVLDGIRQLSAHPASSADGDAS